VASATTMANILIVDDESGIRESLQGILEDEGHKASVSHSGEDCLELLRKATFDVILLDVWLTGIDGLEVLQKIRLLDDLRPRHH
jgi:two-component system, NtrC family, nitrogen regulation response regulator NtrX